MSKIIAFNLTINCAEVKSGEDYALRITNKNDPGNVFYFSNRIQNLTVEKGKVSCTLPPTFDYKLCTYSLKQISDRKEIAEGSVESKMLVDVMRKEEDKITIGIDAGSGTDKSVEAKIKVKDGKPEIINITEAEVKETSKKK